MGKSRKAPYVEITPRTYDPTNAGKFANQPIDLSRQQTPVYKCDTCCDDPNRCRCEIDDDWERGKKLDAREDEYTEEARRNFLINNPDYGPDHPDWGKW